MNHEYKHKIRHCHQLDKTTSGILIYGLNKKMPKTVPYMALVYVIEMNNDTNQIEGIGLVRNFINQDYKTCIYTSDRN